ncbi:MAG: LysR family transcriptional regulator, partial [Oscillospiraceae bacterium]
MDESFEILIRIRITKHDGDKSCAFGFGTAELLRGVSEHGSLNRAAHEMGMAYSKAWKSLRETEKQLGFSLLDRH